MTVTTKAEDYIDENGFYRPAQRREYSEAVPFILRKRILQGYDIDQITILMGVDLGQLARWALQYPAVWAALTPTELEAAAFRAETRASREKAVAARKRRFDRNPSTRIAEAMRSRMWAALKRRGKGSASLRGLPYTMDELAAHLERQLQEGMSWANYGRWHIDHIKPCAAFDLTDPDQFQECWSLANLRPLWASENIRKGAKIDGSSCKESVLEGAELARAQTAL